MRPAAAAVGLAVSRSSVRPLYPAQAASLRQEGSPQPFLFPGTLRLVPGLQHPFHQRVDCAPVRNRELQFPAALKKLAHLFDAQSSGRMRLKGR
jgi:hypothetical protein